MNEKEYYPLIKEKLEELMQDKFDECYLEITAYKKFSNKLKEKISENRDIIFNFLKDAAPDITGYVDSEEISFFFEDLEYVFVVVEVKKGKIKLDDIYQIRKYSELFDAKLSLLISLMEIPEEIKRLSKVVKQLLVQPDNERIILAHFDHRENKFVEWFPKNPFKKPWYKSLF
jgi:hypothetical protein